MACHSSVVCTQTMRCKSPGFPMMFSLTSVQITDDLWFQPITVLDCVACDICWGYPKSNPVSMACKETFLSNLSKPPKSHKSFVWNHFAPMTDTHGSGKEIKNCLQDL